MDAIEEIYKIIGENDSNQDVKDWLSTGLLPLNKAMSGRLAGGFPVGRIIEIYGGPSSGKTLLATRACIETQKKDGLAVFLDHEHAFSLARARALGMSDERGKWIYKQPITAEESFTSIETIAGLIRREYPEKFVTVIVDSVASMVTKTELETEYGNENMKTRLTLPTLMSSALKKLGGVVSKTNITLIFLNQTRDNPGVMFGSKETQPGGNSLKFYASVRIRVSKGSKIKGDGEEIIGEEVTAQTVKNKVYEPFKETKYITHFTNGINLPLSHISALKEMGRLGSTKGWLEFEGKKYRQGDLEKLMAGDPDAYERLLDLFI